MDNQLQNVTCRSLCLVCGDNANGTRYGVPACLGCIVFFRRSVLTNKQYHCSRGGNGKCVIECKSRCICRSCRLRKCFVVGMNPKAIQRRDVMGPRKKQKPISLQSSPISSPDQKQTFPQNSPVFMDPAFSGYSNTHSEKAPSLERLVTLQYRQKTIQKLHPEFADKFRFTSTDKISANLTTDFCGNGLSTTNILELKSSLQRARRHDINCVGVAMLLNAIEWAQSFASFKNLHIKSKMEILRKYSLAFNIVDQGYLTAQQTDPDLWILQNNTFISVDYFRGLTEEETNNADNQTRARLLPPLAVDVINEIAIPFRLLQVDLTECAAMKSILLSCFCGQVNSAVRKQFLNEHETLFTQLMTHCRTKTDDVIERFGNILLLLSNIVKCVHAFSEHIHLISFFQMMEFDAFIKDIFF